MRLTRPRLFAFLALALSSSSAAAEPVVWLEAESFENSGGWSNDTQFVDLMGSPYLLATGVGKPVADAITRAKIPAAGDYRVWVRSKDWLPEHSPGRFQVLVAGEPLPTTFGKAATDAWQWVDGGTLTLPAGAVEVRLHDLTGWWARCDAVVLAPPGFKPEGDLKLLAAQREKFGGVSAAIDDRAFDVVVVGGGMAGCGAAVAAARHGAHVAFVQDRPVLGGNSSQEIQVPVEGDRSNEPWDPFETGLIEEFYPEMRDTSQSRRLATIVTREKNLQLFLNTRATSVEMKDAHTIAAVRAINVRSNQRLRLSAPRFIDCTGHGWIGYYAGADYHAGEEARAEFNEPDAPEKATAHTMGNDLHAASFHAHRQPIPFEPPAWAYHWSNPEAFEPADSHRRVSAGRPANFDAPSHGTGRRPKDDDPNGSVVHAWEVEFGGMHDTIRDAEWIRDELFRINVGLWDYAKNHNPRVHDVNLNREMIWLNYVMGVRESRRLLGDYILTENDYFQHAAQADTVAYSGWGMDVHHPEGFWVRGNDCMHYFRDRKISIPLGSLYSRNIDNLFMAGRCHSATHLGLGGTRIMRSCCLMGQAAGAAAALATHHGCTPRDVDRRHIAELQQMLLKDGCYLIGVPNRDEADLARTARATASSTATAEAAQEPLPPGGTIHKLDRDRAVMFLARGEKLASVALYLQNDTPAAVRVQASLCAASRPDDFTSTVDLITAAAEAPPRHGGWVEFALRADLKRDRPYFLYVPVTGGVAWHLYRGRMAESPRAYRAADGLMHAMPECYKFRLTPGGEPFPPSPVSFGPENVNAGWNRAVHGVRNAWVPDLFGQTLPQWVELDLREPAEINTLHVSFQSRKDRGVEFDIQVLLEHQWQNVATIRGNADRRRVLGFPTVRTGKVRLVLLKTAGSVGVCEIRLYKEP